MGTRVHRAIAFFAVFAWVGFGPSACMIVREDGASPSAPPVEVDSVYADEGLTVSFALPEDGLEDAVLEEMWALQDEGAVIAEELGGMLDGDGSGLEMYDIYYYAPDALALWERLEPLMKAAPLELLYVEFFPADEDEPTRVIEYGDLPDGEEV